MTIASIIGRVGASAALVLGLSAGSIAVAQEKNDKGSEAQSQQEKADNGGGARQQQAPGRSQEMVELQQRVQKLQKEVQELQQKALDNNPELKQQRDDLQALVESKMQAEGVDAEAEQERMKEIRGKMQGGDVSKQQQQELAKEYREKRSTIMKARQSAMQDEEVQKAQKQLREDLQAAMKEQDPEADQLIADYRVAMKELRQKARQSRAQQGGAGGGQGAEGSQEKGMSEGKAGEKGSKDDS